MDLSHLGRLEHEMEMVEHEPFRIMVMHEHHDGHEKTGFTEIIDVALQEIAGEHIYRILPGHPSLFVKPMQSFTKRAGAGERHIYDR